ncbi:MAG: hypothetical protein IJ783_10265 [Kiritimatiellae bacterium]|nr:hypothetical protein [Kiritimatiellia bacterium]
MRNGPGSQLEGRERFGAIRPNRFVSAADDDDCCSYLLAGVSEDDWRSC